MKRCALCGRKISNTRYTYGEYDVLQNFSFDIVRFAFSRYYNNKPYLSDMTQKLQHYIIVV